MKSKRKIVKSQLTKQNADSLMTPEQLSKRWKNSPTVGTLANWRSQGRGPKHTKIEGIVFYNRKTVEKYEQKKEVR